MPYLCRLVAESTEYAGRGAGRAICWLLTGLTSVVRPASRTISWENSNQEHCPALAACTMPPAFLPHNSIMAFAKSTVYVGQPRWSLTTSSVGRVAANFKIVSGKHFPPTPNNHDVRTMQHSGTS